MGQNVLSQSDCRIVFNQPYLQSKSVKSVKSWSKNLGVVRDGCGQPDHRALKLTLSQEWIDEMNWFFACCANSGKLKSNFNNFWVDVVKNGHGHLVHETNFVLYTFDFYMPVYCSFTC